MRSLEWSLTQSDLCPYMKRKFGHRKPHQGGAQTEEILCEDTVKKWPPAGQRERPQKTLNLLTPSSWTSSTQNCEKINPHGLCYSDCGIVLRQP